MLEIIYGRFKVTRCSCGCLFKFQEEDVKYLVKKPLFTFGKPRYDLIGFVECPRCHKRLFKHKGGWV